MNFADLIVEEFKIESDKNAGAEFKKCVPGWDGRHAVLTTDRYIAVVDFERPAAGWQVVSDLPEKTAAQKIMAFPWGGFIGVLLSDNIGLVLDRRGQTVNGFCVPDSPDAFDVWNADLALASYAGDHVGVYRLDPESAAVQALVSPASKTEVVFPGVGRAEGIILEAGRIHLVDGTKRRVHSFPRLRNGPPARARGSSKVLVSDSVDTDEVWVRLDGRMAGIDVGRSAHWIDVGAGSNVLALAQPALLNRPMMRALKRADPVTAKAIAVALAAGQGFLDEPATYSTDREGFIAIVPGTGIDHYVVTTRRVLRIDMGELRKLVRNKRWISLGGVLDEPIEAERSVLGVMSLKSGRMGWLRRIAPFVTSAKSPSAVLPEIVGRGLRVSDLADTLPGKGRIESLREIHCRGQLVIDGSHEPMRDALGLLQSGEPARVRLGLCAVVSSLPSLLQRDLGWWRSFESPFGDDVGNPVYASDKLKRQLLDSMCVLSPDTWPVHRAAGLVALGMKETAGMLRALSASNTVPLARAIAALGLLDLGVGRRSAISTLNSLINEGAVTPRFVLDLLQQIAPQPQMVDLALPHIGGLLTDDALKTVGRCAPARFFEILTAIGATFCLHEFVEVAGCSRIDGAEAFSNLLRVIDVDDLAYETSSLTGIASVLAMALAAPEATMALKLGEFSAVAAALAGDWDLPQRVAKAESPIARTELFSVIAAALWQKAPMLGAILGLVWPFFPHRRIEWKPQISRRRGSVVAFEGHGPPSFAGRGVPSVGRCVEKLEESDEVAVRVLLAVWRRRCRSVSPDEVISLVAQGALDPCRDLRFLLAPCLPRGELVSRKEDFDSKISPIWFDEMVSSWTDEEVRGGGDERVPEASSAYFRRARSIIR